MILINLAALAAAIDIKKYFLTSDPDEPNSESLSRTNAVLSLSGPMALPEKTGLLP
jgi:hypothetical protein